MGIIKVIKNKIKENIINPFDGMINEELSDITTTIGSFIIKNIRGRFQRTISFTIGNDYEDYWMEEALYKILNKYNNINKSSSLDLNTASSYKEHGRITYLKLADGAHSLKYREYKILLIVNNNSISSVNKIFNKTTYTILTYNLDPKFVTLFEKDMIDARNEILEIPRDSPFVNIYKDIHEPDGYTYWQKLSPIPKRKFNSIYLNNDKKELLIKTLNNFISSKNDYIRLGIPWNLKILLHGPAGPQPHSIEIPTPNGLRKFGELNKGDEVFALNGNRSKILSIQEKGNLDVYEIEFEDDRKVLCSNEHRWPTTNDGSDIIEKTTLELIFDKNHKDKKIKIISNSEVDFDYREVIIDPKILGEYLANKNTNKEIQKININNFIPEDYIFNTREIRLELVKGLFADDICQAFDITFAINNKKLLDQIKFILNSLGFNFVLTDRKIYINKKRFITIKDIRILGYKENMRCIRIDDSSHIYQTTGFIPTCNSGKDSICKAIASEYNRNIYYVIGGKGGKFVPNALLSDNKDIVKSPLFIISDIDKYPFLINESEIDLSKDSKDETVFYKQLFGQMINAMDGIMSGDGKIIIMTTNHIDKFSPTFLRPGRIDLIMKIDYVTPDIFRKYVFDNYNEVLPEDIKLKKDDLTISDMNFNLIFLKQNKDEFISSFIK